MIGTKEEKMSRPRVYIAGKLNASAAVYIRNVHDMLAVGNMIRKRGFSVFVPALDVLMGFLDGKMDYEDYFENNIEWLKVTDYMLVLPGWEHSSGTQKEMEIAESHNIPILFDLFSLVVRKERDEKRNAELLDGVFGLHAESRKP